MDGNQLPDIETVAKLVHDSWWEQKKRQGFHAPLDCTSNKHKEYQEAKNKNEAVDKNIDEKFFKWCNRCHPNMYPYEELTDDIKELDRATVRTVYMAISRAGRPEESEED